MSVGIFMQLSTLLKYSFVADGMHASELPV